jgi:hypothetical protein
MARNVKPADKGGVAEEALREYFSNMGSFVVRGVPVKAGGEDVTDVDLWAYTRTSAHSRNITIVDIKNKRRGKPFERAVWVKGLQAAIGADEAIIATQGAKTSVYDFAQKLEIKVISSSTFDAIVRKYSDNPERLYCEELEQEWSNVFIMQDSIKHRMNVARSRFSEGLTFSALNAWIDDAQEVLRIAVDRERRPGPISRAAYLLCAYVAIGADYLGRKHAMSDHEMRSEFFRRGLIFGRTDDSNGRSYIDFAEALVTEHLDPTGGAAAQIRTKFYRSVEKMPVGGLVENFSRTNAGPELFRAAFQLEKEAFRRFPKSPREFEGVEAKSVIGMIADSSGISRKDILGDRTTKDTSSGVATDSATILPQGKLEI